MNLKLFYSILIFIVCSSCQTKNEGDYICKPCNLPCDELTFTAPGICPHCNMKLEKNPILNEVIIEKGSGAFLIEGGEGRKEKSIKIYYHKPEKFTIDSKVLLVIPGAGRNADSYRDTWVETSEKHSTLILSPQYQEKDYDFGDYHLAGLVKNLNIEGNIEFVENTNTVKLDEENVAFSFNSDSSTWLFDDFDRIFDLIKEELSLTTTNYDAFGHSAGGHILHRMVLFQPKSKMDRILASNASFYTIPNFEDTYPFGLKNTSLNEEALITAFTKNLIVFLGEQDNENETRGTFLRSKTADKQGLHRLERGSYFFEAAKAKALELKTDFNWQLITVPRVGHDQEKMGHVAGEFLY